MLHGTSNFYIRDYTGRYDEALGAYVFDYSLEWVDRINPNEKYSLDIKAEKAIKKIHPGAKDYNITIRWNQQIIWKPNYESGKPASIMHDSGKRGNRRRIID